jgi:site-specific DNA recombinase
MPRYRLTENKYRRQQKTGRRKRDRTDWIIHKVEPIISDQLFKKVQDQLKLNVKFKPTNRKHNYLLTGLIKCSCGANRNGDGPTGKKYYRCTSRHKNFDRINQCPVGGINVTIADSLVWKTIASLLSDPTQIRTHAERWIKAQQINKPLNDTQKIRKSLTDVENEQKRYIEAYGKGIINEEMLDHHMRVTNKRKSVIEDELATASKNRAITGKIDIEKLVERTTTKLSDLNFDQKKHIVERVITKIIASPKEMIICGQILVPALATVGKVNYEPINRNRRST